MAWARVRDPDVTGSNVRTPDAGRAVCAARLPKIEIAHKLFVSVATSGRLLIRAAAAGYSLVVSVMKLYSSIAIDARPP